MAKEHSTHGALPEMSSRGVEEDITPKPCLQPVVVHDDTPPLEVQMEKRVWSTSLRYLTACGYLCWRRDEDIFNFVEDQTMTITKTFCTFAQRKNKRLCLIG